MTKVVLIASLATIFIVGCSSGEPEPTTPDSPSAKESPAMPPAETPKTPATEPPVATAAGFARVQEIFKKNCVLCHTGAEAKEGLDLNSYASVMKGKKSGAVINAGAPGESEIMAVIKPGAKTQMPPPPNAPLSAEDVKAIEDWIAAGAKEN
jgi:mono/diheme cytochrome c family protein